MLLTWRTPEQDQAYMGEAFCLRSFYKSVLPIITYKESESERERCTIYRNEIWERGRQLRVDHGSVQ